METQEERVSNTPWQIRCTPEQKRFFQKFVEGTGMNAADTVVKAFEAFRIQIEDDNNESRQILLEADSLVSRLQTMIRSQLVTAIEKQKQCDEERKELVKEKDKYQLFYNETLSKIQNEFEIEKINIENNFQKRIQLLKEEFNTEIKCRESEYIKLKETQEKLDSELQKLEREKSSIQKQYSESLRLYELADESRLESKKKVQELEEKLNQYESFKNRIIELEKENSILQIKLESVIKEEALKREYLDKDLRREFEMKVMLEKK